MQIISSIAVNRLNSIKSGLENMVIYWYFMKHLVEFLMWVWEGAVFVRDRLNLIGTTDQVDSTNQWRKSRLTELVVVQMVVEADAAVSARLLQR